MQRRTLLATLALPVLLAACETPDAARSYLGGFGISARGAALNAPFQFGDLSRWRGQADRAALAVVQVEFLADTFANSAYWSARVNPLVTMQVEAARTELRDYLGIPANAPPSLVMNRLQEAAAAVEAGDTPAAIAALSGPAFTRGGAETLRLLATMPRLPRTAVAAGAVNAEMTRLDNEHQG